MQKTGSSILLTLMLDHHASTPLYQQIYSAMRQAILSGSLPAGTRLPSTRTFASTLGVSRTTVIVAFEQLLYEGYLRGQVGNGTYVEESLPDELLRLPQSSQQGPSKDADRVAHPHTPGLSARGRLIAAAPVAPIQSWEQVILRQTFRHGIPALHEFPFKLWARLAHKRWQKINPDYFGYSDPAGYRPLRQEIAAYLQTARGVRCSEEQIIIVAGSQQAINLAAQLLIDPGDDVWIEDPGYLGARGALLSSGAHLVPVPVDAEGIELEAGIRMSPRARLIYTTPSHQFPTGVTMSLARRLALLRHATRTGAWILEDDYDGEYRYTGHPLASLQGLDQAGRVIYIGTFSKVMFPGLRLGYLVAPPDLIDAFSAAHAAADRNSHMLDQMVLADFMVEEHFSRHVRRMRALYASRQEIMLDALQKEDATGLLTVQPDEAGMHLCAHLPAAYPDVLVSKRAAEQDLILTAISRYAYQHSTRNGLILGYTSFDEQEIRTGIRHLQQLLSQQDWLSGL
ncbi:MocR-like pyridoxine biosynthesis transcription factor PdxR [Dictyobacter arantiisoli]|uniref:GntR family transcriptional regulator n=1 Tax=Dictyobacter arantiisoli TaxID=2014874 RepID=A0A5A5TF85_9CHLR|nr:PLP-dependent aminotransferase family protein [Dictyobacter arantiisoli]GCF09733.1 GntR family transcriptional regulator [Dictyobacter arantiisoli]